MFKRLREKIAEEANKLPVGQNSSGNSGKLIDTSSKSENEDLITLSDSSSVIIPHSSSNFSIADDDEASSESGSPIKKNCNNSAGSELHSMTSTPTSDFSWSKKTPSSQPSNPFTPQTDIESEMEEPPTLNLDEISKDQLFTTIQKLKARNYKYKARYTDVVKEYKSIDEEKKKLEHTLTDNQDKSLRRIAELREQCQLEQNAKAHLEQHLHLILEEKDSRISVLETQINLLKECQTESKKKNEEELESSDEITSEYEQMQKLKSLLAQSKTALVSKSEQINTLLKEKYMWKKSNENLPQPENFEETEAKIRADYEELITSLKVQLSECEKQQEDSVMSMAETKKNMHEELELKERQLILTKEDLKKITNAFNHEKSLSLDRLKQHEQKVVDLQHKLETMEKIMDEEKQSLMKDLSRGKAEAITLMQQENSRKIAEIEDEWKAKFDSLEKEHARALSDKEDSIRQPKVNQETMAEETEVETSKHVVNMEDYFSLQKQLKKLQNERETDLAVEDTDGKLKKVEENYSTQVADLHKQIISLNEQLANLTKENDAQVAIMQNEFNIKTNELTSEWTEKLKKKEKEIQNLQIAVEQKEKEFETKLSQSHAAFEARAHEYATELKSKLESLQSVNTENENELQRKISKLQDDAKRNQNVTAQLKNNLSALEASNTAKVEELNKKIKQLEQERELLMMQAQERVAATEIKYREDLDKLNSQLREVQLQSEDLARLKTENSALNVQLNDNLASASANQTKMNEELSFLKKLVRDLQEEGESSKKQHFIAKEELESAICDLRNENCSLQKCKKELDELNQTVKCLQEELVLGEQMKDQIRNLTNERDQLGSELDSANLLKEEKDQLNQKIRTLEIHKKDLQETVKILISENDNLKSKKSANSGCSKCNDEDINSLKSEIVALKSQAEDLETIAKLTSGTSQKQSEEDTKIHEQSLHQQHQLEIAALKQELFEKECALNEKCEQYEISLKEKTERLREYEKQSPTSLKTDPCSESQSAEASDWDETWVVPDEHCDNITPVHAPTKPDCESHLQQIESLQEELAKANSEVKDLRVLLRLSPPQPLHSNNNYFNSSSHLPQPTEIEYLKNILFKYMMGKETVTLAKVIAAVLRFDEDQTQSVIEKEKARQITK